MRYEGDSITVSGNLRTLPMKPSCDSPMAMLKRV